MARRTDSEIAARVRAGDVRRAEQRRQRLAAAGLVQVVAWVSRETRETLKAEAARRGQGLSETLAALLDNAAALLGGEQDDGHILGGDFSTFVENPVGLEHENPVGEVFAHDMSELVDGLHDISELVDGLHDISELVDGLQDMREPVDTDTTLSLVSVPCERDTLMTEIGAMLDSGMSGGEIARRLNEEGRRTERGKEFNRGNILRDYRKWIERNSPA